LSAGWNTLDIHSGGPVIGHLIERNIVPENF